MIAPRIRYVEVLRGTYHLIDAPIDEHPMELVVRAHIDVKALFRGEHARLEGEVTAGELATERPVRGTLRIDLVGGRRVRYDLAFVSDAGAPLHLGGQKDLNPVAPMDTLTVLPASVYDANGKEIGRARLRFDWRAELAQLLRSIRIDVLSR